MARWRAAVVSVTNEWHEPSGLNLKYVKFAECSRARRFELSSAESSHLNRAGGEAGRLRPSARLCCIIHRPDPSRPPVPPTPQPTGSITHHALDLGGQLALEDEALDVQREK